MTTQNLSKFRQEVRRLLKKHKKSALAKTVRASKKSKHKRGKKQRQSVRRYRSKRSRNGGAIRDGSPQQFTKC
jgi:hypothetical protein